MVDGVKIAMRAKSDTARAGSWIDPQARLADVPARLPDHPASRIPLAASPNCCRATGRPRASTSQPDHSRSHDPVRLRCRSDGYPPSAAGCVYLYCSEWPPSLDRRRHPDRRANRRIETACGCRRYQTRHPPPLSGSFCHAGRPPYCLHVGV